MQSRQLFAAARADGGAHDDLVRRSWCALTAALPVLTRRLACGTLLPGGCRAEERAAHGHWVAALARARREPPPDAATLALLCDAAGYEALLGATFQALSAMRSTPAAAGAAAGAGAAAAAPAEPRRLRAQAFVRSALAAVPATGSLVGAQPGAELQLVWFVETHLAGPGEGGCMEPAFQAAVLAAWAQPAVAAVLRARGSLLGGAAAAREAIAADEARWRAGGAAGGCRRACGLPSCG